MNRKWKAKLISVVNGFVVNKSDWSALQDILLDWGCSHQHWKILNEFIEIHEKDENRCVRKIECPGWMESLHPSIGRLQALQELDLCATLKLRNLPQEIGRLWSLTKLHMTRSSVASLPPSIGQLKNLKVLDLRSTYWLRTLPTKNTRRRMHNIFRLFRTIFSTQSLRRIQDILISRKVGYSL